MINNHFLIQKFILFISLFSLSVLKLKIIIYISKKFFLYLLYILINKLIYKNILLIDINFLIIYVY